MTRILDVVFSVLGLIVASPLLIALLIVVWLDSGSPLFFQSRMGQHQRLFTLVKFRTMRSGTISVATHLVSPDAVTGLGRFLRKTKLDELPQLWNVLKGEMSLVGPRPCLPNQLELIAERAKRNVFHVRPGITGLSQIQGIDMSQPALLAETDAMMVKHLSVTDYFAYIFKTITGSGSGDQVRPD